MRATTGLQREDRDTMAKIQLYSTAELDLWLHVDAGILHHEMKRYPGAKQLEAMLERGLVELEAGHATKWLSDDRKGGALPGSHHHWAETVWGPKAIAAGWKQWALLPPEELVGKMNMTRLRQSYASLGVTVEIFDRPEAAYRWLAGGAPARTG